MPVLSKREYEELKKARNIKNDVLSVPEKKVIMEGKFSPPDNKVYCLLHPENGAEEYQNFQDIINIDGKNYKRNCVNGIVKTKEEVLVEFLLNKGWYLMDKIEINQNKNIFN